MEKLVPFCVDRYVYVYSSFGKLVYGGFPLFVLFSFFVGLIGL